MVARGGVQRRAALEYKPGSVRARKFGPWRVFAALLAWAVASAPIARAQERDATLRAGVALPGHAIVVQHGSGEPRVLCEPDCALTLARDAALRVGFRHDDRIEWRQELRLERDLRLDVRLADHSDVRAVAYALLVTAGALLLATAIVGIATEPEPPDHGWFGANHALVFAGIAGGIVLAFGVPGVGIALAFERDTPTLEVVPEE